MSVDMQDVEPLRRAFRERLPDPTARDCPDADLYWRAWRRELPQAEFDRLVEHTVSCPACAAASRLAREMLQLAEPSSARARPGQRTATRALLAMAATVAFAAFALWLARVPLGGPPTPDWRSPESVTIRALTDETVPLLRGSCDLRWSAGPEGSQYHVTVSDESLRLLAEKRFLREPSFHVPEAALVSMPAGGLLVWQVEVLLPDGTSTRSPTFFQRIE